MSMAVSDKAAPSFAAVMQRVADTLQVTSDTDKARVLGVSPQTFSTWKRRGTVPYEALARLAAERCISLDFLVLGQMGAPVTTSPMSTDDAEPCSYGFLAEMSYHAEAVAILARGTRRSEPYRLGLQYILEVRHRKALGLPPVERRFPYGVGTAEADAWFSGCERGHFEWNARYAAQFGGVYSPQNRGLEHE